MIFMLCSYLISVGSWISFDEILQLWEIGGQPVAVSRRSVHASIIFLFKACKAPHGPVGEF